ncbi:hypothetical protein [Bordetella genomosp. 9]|uniref:hypothetical protein n=1 Tax=Bordetella genomosp. 9 TaxID=1416803 RepID=UPI0012F9BE35|nr:hypothetical protein [Bordetella genomosp. 9]
MNGTSRAMRNAERDAGIRVLARSGVRHIDIAKQYGLSEGRVWQIIHGWEPQREEGSSKLKGAPPTTDTAVIDKAPGGVRPHLRKAESGLWECSDGVIARAAKTPQGAYQRWLTAAIADVQQKAKPAAWPTAAEVKPVARRQATVKGKTTTGVITPPRWAEPPKDPMPAYDGPVTVVPGTAPRRPLTLPTTLQLNGARAAAVQPRMISIAGSTAREAQT